MGIHGLSKLIGDQAPRAVKEGEITAYEGRKIAVDASMSIYQFLIAVRQNGDTLTNEEGETTSHLSGMFYRTIRMISSGLKPIYVFDGKPPVMKSGELAKRAERREAAEVELAKAQEAGDEEGVDKFSRRLVKATKQHSEDCKTLLTLMGVPYFEAPCEAEAQCAALVKAGKAFAVGTEDMDALTFGSSFVLRHLTFSEARKMPIKEFCLAKALTEMELTMEEFIDLCILLGCDYCDTIRGIGPARAITLIKQHHSIEEILKHLDTKKYTVPENWAYKEARELFVKPEIADPESFEPKWTPPDVEGLVEFLSKKNGFLEERVRKGAEKLIKARTATPQTRLDSFFKVLPSAPVEKRKADDKAKKSDAKKGKPGPAGKAAAKPSGKGRPR
eukprot:m.235254 g.235254  ORF g.235254 m.235254 type:complete len:389 (-) comp19964_c0_seq1:23-1189(-)